jgi:hypothetical protein
MNLYVNERGIDMHKELESDARVVREGSEEMVT